MDAARRRLDRQRRHRLAEVVDRVPVGAAVLVRRLGGGDHQHGGMPRPAPIGVPEAGEQRLEGGGRLRAMLSSGAAEVRLTSGGGVDIDLDADGSVDDSLNSCEDAGSDACG